VGGKGRERGGADKERDRRGTFVKRSKGGKETHHEHLGNASISPPGKREEGEKPREREGNRNTMRLTGHLENRGARTTGRKGGKMMEYDN